MSHHHRSQLVVIAERQIRFGDRVVPYVVKRSVVARQVRFEIKTGTGLAVILPRRCSLDAVDEMVQSKSGWILGRIDRFVEPVDTARKVRLGFGDTVPFLGQEARIVKGQEVRSTTSVGLLGGNLVIYCDGEVPELERILEGWYRMQAAMILERRVREHASAFGVQYGRVSIRGQRTRWGSCSHRGTLSFNWRLIMAPEPVVDYVVIHEVAHLKEMNHTRRFWQLVGERCPSWRQHKKWLDDHGMELAAVLSLPQ
jgi:predicted metal-dependent hydrolase